MSIEFSELELFIFDPLLFWIGSENSNVISEYFFSLLSDKSFIGDYEKTRIQFLNEFDEFFDGLNKIKEIKVYPSKTNFFLIDLKTKKSFEQMIDLVVKMKKVFVKGRVVIPQRQVVYLINFPLSKRNYDRFGIQRWLDRGWKVKVFDFTKILKPEYWVYVGGEQLSYGYHGLKIVEDEISALTLLDSLKEGTIFIDNLFWSRAEQKIRQTETLKTMIITTDKNFI